MSTILSAGLPGLIKDETARPVMAEAHAIADAIRGKHGDAVGAIVFYGSCLRSADPHGVLDFYVLVEDYSAYYGKKLPAFFNRLLPPNVSYWEVPGDTGPVRAKVAVISLARFAALMQAEALDTTLWARFAQPAALIYARDAGTHTWVVEALADAVATAAHWAVRLGPYTAMPADYWTGLFRATYSAELRVEREDRSSQIISADQDRYGDYFRPALARAGVPWTDGAGGLVRPYVSSNDRSQALSRWRTRRWLGKVLNIARLIKAAFTFEGGAGYLAWKIERHTGKVLHLTPWQRRHPILATPGVWFRLWRHGGLR